MLLFIKSLEKQQAWQLDLIACKENNTCVTIKLIVWLPHWRTDSISFFFLIRSIQVRNISWWEEGGEIGFNQIYLHLCEDSKFHSNQMFVHFNFSMKNMYAGCWRSNLIKWRGGGEGERQMSWTCLLIILYTFSIQECLLEQTTWDIWVVLTYCLYLSSSIHNLCRIVLSKQ